jgi:hypothetical protein
MIYSENVALRDFIALEIRLAMQQEAFDQKVNRLGIAEVRAARILAKLDGTEPAELTNVPMDIAERAYNQLLGHRSERPLLNPRLED